MATPWVGTKPGLFVNDSYSPVAVDAPNLNAMVDTVDRLNEQKSLLDGLICAPALGGLPEWPDGASPTYLTIKFSTVDGWATMGTDTVVTAASNKLVLTAGAAPTTFVRANKALAVSSKTVRIKWACAQTDLTTLEIGTSGAGTHVTKSIAGQTSGITDITTGANFTDIEVLFNSTGNNTNPVYVSFIYIGDGTYSSLALDASGSGNHGTVYGATPVDTPAERGLSFDKLNDYTATSIFAMPSIYTFRALIINCLQDASNIQMLCGYGITLSGRLLLYRVANSNSLAVGWYNGSANQTETVTNVFSNEEDDTADFLFSINWTSGAYAVWLNGISFATGTLAGVVKPTTGYALYIGAQQTLTALQWFGGTIADPRIYNRALSAEEVWSLYQNPGAFKPSAIIDAATAVPNARAVYSSTGFLASTDPTSIVTAGSVGYQTAIDVASGGTLTMPAGSGTYFWTILTYGATINSVKLGTTAAGAAATGTASANLTVLVKRIS